MGQSRSNCCLKEVDTYNSKMHRGEIYHNLPLMMDELTNTVGGKLSDLAYQLTGGTAA